MRNNLETSVLRDGAERCEDLSDIRALLRQYEDDYVSWQRYATRLVDESGLSYGRLAERCGISKNTIKKWCTQGGSPRCRNTFLKLGFGLHMNSEEVDTLLARYGGYHKLYARDLFDAACIFLLDRPRAYTYADAQALYLRCAAQAAPQTAAPLATEYLRRSIADASDEEALLAFVRAHAEEFRASRDRLTAYLRAFLTARIQEGALCGDDPRSIHAYFAACGIPARYEKLLSELFRHGEVPRREQLIALGLYLEMTPEELDEMLPLAGMEPLCAKNRLECVILFALRQLCLCHPELPMSNAMQLLTVTRDEAVAARCRQTVAEYSANVYHCAPDDACGVADYVRGILGALDLGEAGELFELL